MQEGRRMQKESSAGEMVAEADRCIKGAVCRGEETLNPFARFSNPMVKQNKGKLCSLKQRHSCDKVTSH